MKGPIQIVYEFRVDWIKKERHEGEAGWRGAENDLKMNLEG